MLFKTVELEGLPEGEANSLVLPTVEPSNINFELVCRVSWGAVTWILYPDLSLIYGGGVVSLFSFYNLLIILS